VDLGEKPLATHRRRDLRVKDLDRDTPVVPEIVGEVDRSHPARADLTLEAVTTGKSGYETGIGCHALTCGKSEN
jgi:hypothetical protein